MRTVFLHVEFLSNRSSSWRGDNIWVSIRMSTIRGAIRPFDQKMNNVFRKGIRVDLFAYQSST